MSIRLTDLPPDVQDRIAREERERRGVTLPKPAIARGVRRVPGQMNKLEAAYAKRLETMQALGEVSWYAFDAIKLRLAAATFYTPDFLVLMSNGELEVHEVKGHWEDDARVKIKVAAEKYPFRFVALTRVGGEWKKEDFGGETRRARRGISRWDSH